jgi:transcription elongation factor Elf1
MDITFSCDKCGQSIVIDEAGAGITVDCPNCRQSGICRAMVRQLVSKLPDLQGVK